MAETTSVKLPPELEARVSALARKSGRTTHSFILEAVERHAAREEKLQSFVKGPWPPMPISSEPARYTGRKTCMHGSNGWPGAPKPRPRSRELDYPD